MGAREEQIARNEALFRSVNERVRELATTAVATEPAAVAFVCECGRGDCTATVELPIPNYERVRADPTQFLVVTGHGSPHVEHVVERHDGYDVVRKHPDEAGIAIETDPRPRE